MEKYIINEKTLMIKYKDINTTEIIEFYNKYEINKSTYDVINESCLYYGSSLKGRIDATNRNIGIKYKAPIIISEKRKLVFFPTNSYQNINCSWININGIDTYMSKNDCGILVRLINHENIELNITRNIFNNQILKAYRLDSLLKSKNR